MDPNASKSIHDRIWAGFKEVTDKRWEQRAIEDREQHKLNTTNMVAAYLINGTSAADALRDMQLQAQLTLNEDRYREDLDLARGMFDAVLSCVPKGTDLMCAPLSTTAPRVSTPRPTLSTSQVAAHKLVIESPKRSNKYYVLDCPLCQRHFHSSASMYAHLNQDNSAHRELLGNQRTFAQAVAVCGARVTDATPGWVAKHNDAKAMADVSIHCL
jgi:hypothetical protein